MSRDLVATVITRAGEGETLDAAISAVRAAFGGGDTAVLTADEAADVFFASANDLTGLRAGAHAALDDLPADVVVQPYEGRRKRLLIADMDSTMIGQECIDELAAHAGVKDQVAAITERAMRGELEFEGALRERMALLAGLDANAIATVLAERITVNPGAMALVWTMRANGARTLLVSGGFTAFAEPVARRIGFDEVRANRLIEADGKLTGAVAEPILGRQAKLGFLEDAIIRFGLTADETMAVGDGANDLAMIGRAGLGVAYRAKPKVAEAAAARIDHTSLAALLFAQGYARADFATETAIDDEEDARS